MKNALLLVLIALVLIGCGSAKNDAISGSNSEGFDDLKVLAESGRFKFNAEVMYPLETQDIANTANNVLGRFGNDGSYVGLKSGYFFKIKNDSIIAKLPYIGEMQRVTSYGKTDNSGIILNNPIKNYSIDSTKQKHLKIKFETSNENESYNILVKLFPSKTADVVINGSNRSIIRYRGPVTPIKD